MPATAPTNVTIAIMNADNASARKRLSETTAWPVRILAATIAPVANAPMLAKAWIVSIVWRLRTWLIMPEATAGIESSKISIIAASTPERSQTFNVDGFEVFSDPINEDFQDQHSD